MKDEEEGWMDKALEDAERILTDNLDDIVQCCQEGGEFPRFFSDVVSIDDAVMEMTTADGLSLVEAAQLLAELSQYKETDRGLWKGMEPADAVCSQAYWTYRSAVQSEIQDYVKKAYLDTAVTKAVSSLYEEDTDENRERLKHSVLSCWNCLRCPNCHVEGDFNSLAWRGGVCGPCANQEIDLGQRSQYEEG